MKKTILAIIVCFLSIIAAAAQNPTPTPVDEDGVVKITTTLIQVDVSVTDGDGKQVTDLKPEEFEIFENGDKQEITNFSYVAVTPDVRNQTQNQLTVNSRQVVIPPVPTLISADQVRRTIVLVVDDVGMSLASMANVRAALKKFVDEQMQEGDLVAIIRTSAGISAFQQFTTDKRVLRAAIEKLKWNVALGTINIFERVEPTLKETLAGTQRSNGTVRSPQGNETDKEFEADNRELREGIFTAGTLGTLRYIVRGLNKMPGRKAVVLFSDGFDVYQGGGANTSLGSAYVVQALDKVIEEANRAGVVVNTIDSRGLQNPAMFTAEDDTTGLTFEGLERIQQQRMDTFRNKQTGLAVLAEKTGGRFFRNNNGLSNGVRNAVNDLNGYYLLAYQPDSDTFDANRRKFNKLEVRVKRKDVKVRYRSGFFNITDERLLPTTQTVQTPQQKMMEALFSPFGASGITMRMTSVFANDVREGNYVRAFLHIDGKSITFADEANGNKKLSFDVIGYTFDAQGKISDSFGKNHAITVKPEKAQWLIENGLIYSMRVPVKKAGAYQLRVAVRDTNSDRIGAATQFIEVPNLDKDRIALSGIILQNMTAGQWQARVSGKAQTDSAQANTEIQDAQTATATRIFRRSTVLLFNYVVYNAKQDSSRKVQVQTQARLYRDGELVFEGKLSQLNTAGQTDLKRIEADGAIMLGKNLAPGDYVLQIVAVDALAKQSKQVQAQFIDFELVE